MSTNFIETPTIELHSPNDFLELFQPNAHKCHVPLPETLVFKDGAPISWLFFHENTIKFKKKSKIDSKNVLQSFTNRIFSGISQETGLSPNKTLNEMLFLSSKPEVAVVRSINHETLQVNPYELSKIIEERAREVRVIQRIIEDKPNFSEKTEENMSFSRKTQGKREFSKDFETIYCKYSRNLMSFSFVCYKKSMKVRFFLSFCIVFKHLLIKKNNPNPRDLQYLQSLRQNLKEIPEEGLEKGPILDYLLSLSQVFLRKTENFREFAEKKRFSNKNTCRFLYKSQENAINQRIQALTLELVNYWQFLYGFTVKTTTTKFIRPVSKENPLFFVGTKQISIENLKNFKENTATLSTSRLKTRDFPIKLSKNLEEIRPKGTIPVFSKKLLEKLALELCAGDFCQYEFLGPAKDLLKPKKKEYLEENQVNHNQKVLGSEFGSRLPFVLVNKTLINVRTHWEKVIRLLRKHRIVPGLDGDFKNPKETHEIDLTGDLSQLEYPQQPPKRTWTLKPSDLYRQVKICSRCFQIYSFISANAVFSQENNQNSMKWNHSEKKFMEKAKEFSRLLAKNPGNVTQRTAITTLTAREKEEKNTISARDQEKNKKKNASSVVLTAKDQLLDSTRLNLGLIHNKSPPFSQSDFSLVSKVLQKLAFSPPHYPSHAKSSKSCRSLTEMCQYSLDNFDHFPNFGVQSPSEFEELPPKLHYTSTPKSPKRKLTSPNLNSLDLIKKRESLTERLLSNLSRNFDKKRSKVLDFYESRKKILSLTQGKRKEDAVSLFHFKNFSHLRVLADYKLHIPKLCLHATREKCKKKLVELGFEALVELLSQRNPRFYGEIREKMQEIYRIPDIFHTVKVFVYDEFTAVPYLLLRSARKTRERGHKIAKFDNIPPLKLKKSRVFVILHDFFHNCLENFAFYQSLADFFLDSTFLLLNFPGQAFTVCDASRTFNNVELSRLLDSLLFELTTKNLISLDREEMHFVGLGYGALTLAYFLGSAEEAMQIRGVLLVNGFSYLDEMTFAGLSQCLTAFDDCPENMPELAFDYFARLTTSLPRSFSEKALEEKLFANPLSISERNRILRGCFRSVNCADKVQSSKIPIFAVHSLQNALVRVGHVDVWMKIQESSEHAGKKLRTAAYVEGGHDVFEENAEGFRKLLVDFLENSTG